MRSCALLFVFWLAAICCGARESFATSEPAMDSHAGAHSEPAAAPAPAPMTYVIGPVAERVRRFRRTGDALVNGDASAYEARMALNAELAKELLALPLKDWNERQNATELIIYVLFGGDAGVLRAAIASETFYEPLKKCAAAVLAYADRDIESAQKLLAELDREALPGSILSPLNLVEGAVRLPKAPAEAVRPLEMARIELAGTAIEESALRQLVLAHLAAGQHKEAARTLSDYFRRFPASLYADRFSQLAAQKFSSVGGEIDKVLIQLSEREMPAAAKKRHLQLLLNAAKYFLRAAKLEAARSMASFVMSRSDKASDEQRQAEYYELVLNAALDKPAEALAKLTALDKSHFSQEEQETMEAAISVARQVLEGVPDTDTPVVQPRALQAISKESPKVAAAAAADQPAADESAGSTLTEDWTSKVETAIKEAEKQLTVKN